jgi:hypothetical protein
MRSATLHVPDWAARFVHLSRTPSRSCRCQEARGIVAAMNRLLPTLSLLAGGVLIVIAVIYAVEPAASLPSFFPGHVGATDPEHAHHHVKHAIAAFAVGLAAFAYAWFATGPARRPGAARSQAS